MHKYPFGSTVEIPGGRPGLLILAYFGHLLVGWVGLSAMHSELIR